MRNNRILQPKDYLSLSGHTDKEEEATIFTPVTSNGEFGKVIIRGMENDRYEVFETETSDGYTLLDMAYTVQILAEQDNSKQCDIYSEDVLGLLQNDPRYQYSDVELPLTNIPQKQLSHYGIRAAADSGGGAKIVMLPDGTSANAEVQITVINTRGFDLPQTGDQGVWMYGVAGGTLMLAAVLVVFLAFKKKDENQTMRH